MPSICCMTWASETGDPADGTFSRLLLAGQSRYLIDRGKGKGKGKMKVTFQNLAMRLGAVRMVCAFALANAAVGLTPQPALAGQTYDECVRQACSLNDYIGCGMNCRQGNARPAPSLAVPILYGAIVLETSTLITGAAKGYATSADAERRAIAMCRRSGGSANGCRVVELGHNVCLALATSRGSGGQGNSWGAWHSDDGWVSQRGAVRECRGAGGTNCAVVVKFCTG
jgi:Domain of unknown function (DUF4189)